MRTANIGFFIVISAGCTPAQPGPAGARATAPSTAIPADAEQAIIVWQSSEKVFQVAMVAKERRGNGQWSQVFPVMQGVIGPNGFAPLGEKRESDGRTPRGVFNIGVAFGYAPRIDTGLDYRHATVADYWVDDPASPQYNRWVTGKPEAKSFEKLRIDAYKYAAVIEYNTDPVIPGNGSAIFLHVWSGPEKPTAGCVALAESDVRKLLAWLDRRRHPVILLNNP